MRYTEGYRRGHNENDSKSFDGQKPSVGSNPTPSASEKPSHIKAFAHMTGLFFSLKVTSAYMIFGKNSGVPAGLPCVRQSQDIVHYICRGDLGLVIQMAVNIRRRADIAVTQPLLDLLQRHIVRQKQ